MRTWRSAPILLALGITLGVGIWLASPWLIGTAEPWDAEAPIWGASWLGVALLGGLFGRLSGVCLPVGYALGQFLITIRSPLGEFGLLGWSFIAGYAVAAILVALAVIGCIQLVRRIRALARSRRAGRES